MNAPLLESRYRTLHLVPCFLISFLTILGFLLAPDSGEKLTLRKQPLALFRISHACLLRDHHSPLGGHVQSGAVRNHAAEFLCRADHLSLLLVCHVHVHGVRRGVRSRHILALSQREELHDANVGECTRRVNDEQIPCRTLIADSQVHLQLSRLVPTDGSS